MVDELRAAFLLPVYYFIKGMATIGAGAYRNEDTRFPDYSGCHAWMPKLPFYPVHGQKTYPQYLSDMLLNRRQADATILTMITLLTGCSRRQHPMSYSTRLPGFHVIARNFFVNELLMNDHV